MNWKRLFKLACLLFAVCAATESVAVTMSVRNNTPTYCTVRWYTTIGGSLIGGWPTIASGAVGGPYTTASAQAISITGYNGVTWVGTFDGEYVYGPAVWFTNVFTALTFTNTEALYGDVAFVVRSNGVAILNTNALLAPGGTFYWGATNYGVSNSPFTFTVTSSDLDMARSSGSFYQYGWSVTNQPTQERGLQLLTNKPNDTVRWGWTNPSLVLPTVASSGRQTDYSTAAAIATTAEYNANMRQVESFQQLANIANEERRSANALYDQAAQAAYNAHGDAVSALQEAQRWGAAITNSVRDMSVAQRTQAATEAQAAITAANARLTAITNYVAQLSNQRAIADFNASSNAAFLAGYNTTLTTNALGGIQTALVNSDFQLQYLTNLLTGQRELLTVGMALSSNQWVLANQGTADMLGALERVVETTSNQWQQVVGGRAENLAGNAAILEGLSNVVKAVQEGGGSSNGAPIGNLGTNIGGAWTYEPEPLGAPEFDSTSNIRLAETVVRPTVSSVAPVLAIPLGSLGVGGLADVSMNFGSAPLADICAAVRLFLLVLMTVGFVYHQICVLGHSAPR